MFAFALVVDNELRERTAEVPVTQRYDPFHAFLVDRTKKLLRLRIAVGARNGVRITRMPDVSSTCRTALLQFRSRSQIRKHRPAQDTVGPVSEVTCDLEHEGLVRMRRGADCVQVPRGQVDHK